MNYIIFGAGYFGECAIRTLGMPRVKCFVDNNPDKKMYWDKEVIRFGDFIETGKVIDPEF